jgi:biopolymer transport protein ExbD
MPKVKIPRKSTTIDMTAMCDVAFLLLSFFILATKQKPPEALNVKTPNSVSAVAVPDKSIMITMTQDGKVFISLGDDTKKTAIISQINSSKALGLDPGEIEALAKSEFIGLPFNQIKESLGMKLTPDMCSGIPVDSTNNQLKDWLGAVRQSYVGLTMDQLEDLLLIKGDEKTKYPIFKNVKEAFTGNDIQKFRIVTNGKPVPEGSELFLKESADSKKSGS